MDHLPFHLAGSTFISDFGMCVLCAFTILNIEFVSITQFTQINKLGDLTPEI